MERIKLGQKIGSGWFRDCYEVLGNPDQCAKVIRDKRRREVKLFSKRAGIKINVNVPTSFWIFRVFGFADLNGLELKLLRSLPEELRAHTSQNVHLAITEKRKKALVADRPKDYDGSYSKTLKDSGPISDPSFWSEMERLIHIMKTSNTHLMDIQNPENIILQKVSPEEWRPVFIDVKCVGHRGSTLQTLSGRRRNKENQDRALDEQYLTLREKCAADPKISEAVSVSIPILQVV